MTMLSLTYNDGFPVILSDILFTSTAGEKGFSLPTHLEGTKRLIDNNCITSSPVDLRQKVYIINDRLCIVLGGRQDQMYSFLNYMEAFFRDKIPSPEELNVSLNAFDKDKRSDLLAMVILAIPNDDSIEFDIKTIGKWQEISHEIFGFIYSGGSGANDFLKTAKEYIGGFGHSNPFNKALTQNLDLLSKFMEFECTTADSIINRWGAGFELTYFFNGKFKKLKEYTYVLFGGIYDRKSGLECWPYAVLKYKYYDDNLVIRAANNEKEKLFQVNPINKNDKLIFDNSIIPDYQSKDLILGYIIKLPDGKLYYPSCVILCDSLDHVKLKVNKGRLDIIAKESLTLHITQEIEKLYER